MDDFSSEFRLFEPSVPTERTISRRTGNPDDPLHFDPSMKDV